MDGIGAVCTLTPLFPLPPALRLPLANPSVAPSMDTEWLKTKAATNNAGKSPCWVFESTATGIPHEAVRHRVI